MNAKAIGVGLIGFGNIGAGVVAALHANRQDIERRLARPLRLARIADKDTTTRRETAGFDYTAILTDDAGAVLEGRDVDVVVELVGGYEPARTLVERALKAGKHVVTANKAMLSKFGPALMATARAHKVQLLFEASVGGGIPIIRALQQGLAANRFRAIYGIVNGTTNYILTQMAREGASFDKALKEAQAKGYAEPDPTFDVEGVDTAQKTAILGWLAFGTPPGHDAVHVEGITRIRPEDLIFAEENGFAIKLLGIVRREADGGVELRAHPALVPRRSMLAGVEGVYNAIVVDGEPIGQTFFFGRGAGRDATSSAVLSDVMALADGIASGGLDRESRLLRGDGDGPPPRLVPMGRIEEACCLRSREGKGAGEAMLAALKRAGVAIKFQRAYHNGATHVLTAPVRGDALDAALASLGGEPPLVLRVVEV